MKSSTKVRRSLSPVYFKGGWFYEYRGRLDVVMEGGRGPIIRVPWRKIIEAAKRCRPEAFK